MHITIEIDGEARALYVRLRDGGIAETIEYPEQQEIFPDLDEQGQLLGIEVLEPPGVDLVSIFKNIARDYGVDDLSSLVNKSLVELAA